MDILPENERVELESRLYSNPQIGLDESSSFIEKLRQTQQANTQQITQDTANLGTEVPSNLGGLTGGEGYWTSRYQIPQTNAAVQNLRAAAQAQALNDVLANEQAIWKKRYQDVYREYQKRQNAKANRAYSSGGSGNNSNQSGWSGEIDLQSTEDILEDPDNSVDNNKQPEPPKEEDYMVDGKEQTKRIQERSGLPDWLVNVLKIFG